MLLTSMKRIKGKSSLIKLLILISQLCLLTLSLSWMAKRADATNLQLETARAKQSNQLAVTPTSSTLEPKAIDLLKAMSARLAAARTLSFTAITTYESPSRLGPPLAYMTRSEVILQRPDKLQVLVPGDGSASEFYYNGKTMMAFAPAENLVAVADAPPTIDATLKAAYDSAAIYFPFTDVIVANPYQDIANGLKLAFYVGQSQMIDGITTDIIAIANDKVFAQVWIGTNDKLPRLIRAVYADDPSRLRHQVAFSNWQLDGPLPAGAFASPRADSAKRIPFARPEPKTATSSSPAKVEPSKTP